MLLVHITSLFIYVRTATTGSSSHSICLQYCSAQSKTIIITFLPISGKLLPGCNIDNIMILILAYEMS